MKIEIHFSRKKSLLFVMGFLVCVICFPTFVVRGQDDKWELYYTANKGSEYYYDVQSIDRTSKILTKKDTRRFIRSRQKIKKAWMVKVREKIIFIGPDSELNESKILREFDCSAKKAHILMRSDFHKNGTLQIKGKSAVWKGIDSEPQLDTLFSLVCPS